MIRTPVIAAVICLTAGGCASTTAGTATRLAGPSELVAPTTVATLPALLLPAAGVGTAIGHEVVVTREVSTVWADSGHLPDGCLAIAGAAQKNAYANSGWTAVHGQVLRDPPGASTWSHLAVQAVVLFPTAQAASDFLTRSRDDWSGCANRELTYVEQPAPDQVWSVGPASTDHDLLTVSRVQRSPEQWSCQRALTVRGTVAVDVEACNLNGATSAAAEIATAIGDRLPAA